MKKILLLINLFSVAAFGQIGYVGTVNLNTNSITYDAGGFTRVSQQTTLFDGKILNADDSFIWETAGDGSGSFSNNKFVMNVSPTKYLIRQSKRYFPYFSGKSQRVEMTLDSFGVQTGITKRAGYFSSNAVSPYSSNYDGFWIENTGTSICMKVYRDGVKVDSTNITGWSGYQNLSEYQTLSTWNKFTVVEFKYLWLGGAVLVMSVKTSNGFVEAYRFNYAGTSSDVIFKSPNQPVRYEIRNTGAGEGTMRAICSQVSTEGSINESGEGLSVFNTTPLSTNTVGTIYALVGLKKQTTYRDNAIQIIDASVAITASTDAGIMMLIVNPTLSGALSYSNNSRIQVAIATNQTITAGTGRVIASYPITQSTASGSILTNNYLAWLSSTIANTHDEYVLAYMPTTNNQTVNGMINLKEY